MREKDHMIWSPIQWKGRGGGSPNAMDVFIVHQECGFKTFAERRQARGSENARENDLKFTRMISIETVYRVCYM